MRIRRLAKLLFEYPRFVRQYLTYRRMPGGVIQEIQARLGERTASSSISPHYFYQGVWAFEKILISKVQKHVDIGAEVNWVGVLTRITKVVSVELRPLNAKLDNFEGLRGDILHLPFPDKSVQSLSCLHVAEHIGLGRYGDELDPEGTKKACHELARVLAQGGSIYFSLPIGRERTVFNAHRIHDPATILGYFSELELKEFSAVTDRGEYVRNVNPKEFNTAKYACGLFHFSRTATR